MTCSRATTGSHWGHKRDVVTGQANILVISDLHLGEEIRPEVHNAEDFEQLGRELCNFVEHYANNPRNGRPWRLIINGDMVDFLGVCVLPSDVGEVRGLMHDDHVWGLGTSARAALLKMNMVLDRHGGVFEALAHFVGQGNQLEVVVGNHDAEFVWPQVQEAFIEAIVTKWAGSERSLHDGMRTADQVRAAVRFHEWFYFEEGTVWCEHGHQYDAYCSVDLVLDPRDSTEETELEQNVGSAVMYYLGNHLPDSPEDNQGKGFVQYLRVLWERLDIGASLLGGYFLMNRRLAAQWRTRLSSPALWTERRRAHDSKLAALADAVRLPVATINELFGLRRQPVYLNFSEWAPAVFLPRFVLTIAAVILAPVLLLTVAWPTAPIAVFTMFVLVAFAHLALALGREETDPRLTMMQAAQQIKERVRAPIVVMGHSHHPVAKRLDDGGWYFNTGTWVGGAGKLRNFTHLMIEHGDKGLQAALCQWKDGRSWELRAEKVWGRYRAPWGLARHKA